MDWIGNRDEMWEVDVGETGREKGDEDNITWDLER